MLLDKIKNKNINAKLLMIGDKMTDKIAAQKAKINFFLKKKFFLSD